MKRAKRLPASEDMQDAARLIAEAMTPSLIELRKSMLACGDAIAECGREYLAAMARIEAEVRGPEYDPWTGERNW